MRATHLASLSLQEFMAFKKVKLEFAPGLNLIVGENGTGKSTILKLGYALVSSLAKLGAEDPKRNESILAERLTAVLKPDRLPNLTRRGATKAARVTATMTGAAGVLDLTLVARAKSVRLHNQPSGWEGLKATYLGPHELLTAYPGYLSLTDQYRLPFDGTWRETISQLGLPLVAPRREAAARRLAAPLEKEMGGAVVLEGDHFYLELPSGRMEMHLVAEGMRKLGMVARLVANGSLLGPACLFWDEPETNLNPKQIKLIARTMLHLCRQHVQIVAATHSLFLMRELDVLLRTSEFKDVPRRFFGLHRSGDDVRAQQGEAIEDADEITSLQEELSQSDRYMAVEDGAGRVMDAKGVR